MKRNIQAIDIYTAVQSVSLEYEYESITFYRDGFYSTGHGNRNYRIPATRDSFYRAIRAMRRLAVRKYINGYSTSTSP